MSKFYIIFLLLLFTTISFALPFPQEVAQKWTLKNNLPFLPTDITVDNEGNLWLLGKGKLAQYKNNVFFVQALREKKPSVLYWSKKGLYIGGSKGLWKQQQGQSVLVEKSLGAVTHIDQDLDGRMWMVAESTLYFEKDKTWKKFRKVDAKIRNIEIWGEKKGAVATDLGVWLLKGKRHYYMELLSRPNGLLDMDVRCVKRDASGHLFVGSRKGLNIFDLRHTWVAITGDQLGCPNITSVDFSADGTLWVGSTIGIMRFRHGKWAYFSSQRWLPDDHILKVVALNDGSAYILTPKGVCLLGQKQMALKEKADYYQVMVDKYFNRFGFIMSRRLSKVGDINSGKVGISDNDGLWTSLYIAAQSFRYATLIKAGKKEQAQRALEAARKSLDALIFLQKVTGIPGFPARAVRHKSEPEYGNGHSEWTKTEDGEWEWKGETSSDETTGHYFGLFVAYQLLTDKEDKDKIREATRGMTDHIVKNNLTLVDRDGKPTTWGVWGPDHLNEIEMWSWEKGLNSLEILSHLKVAYHIVKDERYKKIYNELIQKHHYATNVVYQKIIEPYQVYHDNQLAYLSYYPLLLLEQDKDLQRLYLMSLGNTFRHVKRERCPVWNFINSLFIPDTATVREGVDTLQEISLDLISWTMRNNHRKDIPRQKKNRWQSEDLAVTPLPYTQRRYRRWDGNPYRLDGGNNGREAAEPTFFLFPYWMARYHGLLSEQD